MKQIQGVWFPDQEAHLVQMLRDGKYQAPAREAAIMCCSKRDVAIDIGAHCGLWSMDLVREFDIVYAFEPVEEHRQCFMKNVRGDYRLFRYALGAEPGSVSMRLEPDNTGHTHIGGNDLVVEMTTLDLMRDIEDPDFIKIDCEGYEYYVLKGGEDLIKRTQPVICLEQKDHGFYGLDKLAGVKLLVEWGAHELGRVRDDWIMGWN